MKKLILCGLLVSAIAVYADDQATIVSQPTSTITAAPLASEPGSDTATRVLERDDIKLHHILSF
jgi:hypothetical protein